MNSSIKYNFSHVRHFHLKCLFFFFLTINSLSEQPRIQQNCQRQYHTPIIYESMLYQKKLAILMGPSTYLDLPQLHTDSNPSQDNRQTDITYLHILTVSTEKPDCQQTHLPFFILTEHKNLKIEKLLVITYLQGQFIKKHTQKFHVSRLK